MRYALTLMIFGFALVSASADRFDHKVRAKFFAGLAGDKAALDEGMAVCESVLADNPEHAEAMVWYGTGLFMRSVDAFRSQDRAKGTELYNKSVETMDRAVALRPDDVAVRAPRGGALLNASRFMPAAAGRPLLERGLSDYEHILQMQSVYFDTLGQLPRGELLFGLAEGWSRAGDEAKATHFFTRVTKELPKTEYARRAEKWLQTKTLTQAETGCVGCHTAK
jgi:hypothetical protein